MATTTPELYVPLSAGRVHLEPLTEDHREPLRAACALDDEIWAIYPYSMAGAAFAGNFYALLSDGRRRVYAVHDGEALVGMTSYYDHSPANNSVAIGGTYIAPAARGGPFNLAMKRLMIDHARACGIHRIVFEVDTRNTRSIAAVLKLGAVREGTLRQNRTTWTGYLRDTAIFSLLPGEESAALRGAVA